MSTIQNSVASEKNENTSSKKEKRLRILNSAINRSFFGSILISFAIAVICYRLKVEIKDCIAAGLMIFSGIASISISILESIKACSDDS